MDAAAQAGPAQQEAIAEGRAYATMSEEDAAAAAAALEADLSASLHTLPAEQRSGAIIHHRAIWWQVVFTMRCSFKQSRAEVSARQIQHYRRTL